VKNVNLLFHEKVAEHRDKTLFIVKENGRWKEMTWLEAAEKVKLTALGLISLAHEVGDHVAIASATRVETALSYLGISNAAGVYAAIYFTNSPAEVQHIMINSGAKFAFVEDQEQVDKFLKIRGNLPNLKKVIVFEKTFRPKEDALFMSLDDLMNQGKLSLSKNIEESEKLYQNRINFNEPDDVNSIVYTSGTTGTQKGAMLTHRSIISSMQKFAKIYPLTSGKDRGIAFLPMAHVVELTIGMWMRLYNGICYGFAERVETVYEDMYEIEPTYVISTPRFFEKFYNRIVGIIEDAPWFRKLIIKFCLWIGNKVFEYKERQRKVPLFYILLNFINYIILARKIQDIVGKNIRFFHSAGAPIAPKIIRFFNAVGMPIYEGYGMTEIAPVTANTEKEFRIGSVGKVNPEVVDLKLGPDNEILLKGENLFAGYKNDPDATKNAFDAEGYLHTGDEGRLDDDGYLYIVDRMKDIIITSSGKNIAPGYIENIMKTSRYIDQAMVYGDRKNYLVAVITPDKEELIKYARDNGLIYTDFASLTKKKEIIDLIKNEIETRNKEVARVERVRDFIILEDRLYQDDGEVTPTMKVKRRNLIKRYGDQLESLYKKEFSDL
jgi:long-chain acyl-CoA synthetase